jgi:hypothetical protein
MASTPATPDRQISGEALEQPPTVSRASRYPQLENFSFTAPPTFAFPQSNVAGVIKYNTISKEAGQATSFDFTATNLRTSSDQQAALIEGPCGDNWIFDSSLLDVHAEQPPISRHIKMAEDLMAGEDEEVFHFHSF